jgi:lysophospholipase L1-like esterase
MAFGDSMTSGTFSTAGAPLVYFAAADEAYPVVLQRLLQQRYREQVISVQNEGGPGESAFAAWLRLQEKLRVHRPEVLLLMAGANDLFSCAGLSAALVNGCVAQAVSSLNRLVSEARFSQVPVFVATLPPQRPGTPRGVAFALVDQYNRGVREVARGEAPNATLVDVNVYFGGHLTFIGPDGLHPTAQGYAVIAQAFFDTITRLYQLPATAAATADPTD